MKQDFGALPDHAIQSLPFFRDGFSIGPASIDIPCGDEFYRLPTEMKPGIDQTVANLIDRFGRRHSNESPLEVGITYAVRLYNFILPEYVYGYFNPKSSIGRVDLHCRVVADRVARFDTLRPEGRFGGYKGDVWLLLTPKSFAVMPPVGIPLVQLRLFNQDTRFKQEELEAEWAINPLAYKADSGQPYELDEFRMTDRDGTLLFTIDLNVRNDGFAGYRAKVTREVLDLRNVDHYDWQDFFDEVPVRRGGLLIAPDIFYLLRTKEECFIPPHLAAEVVAMDPKIFEGRSHYAGFIDPGFRGRVTLEVRCSGMFLHPGQPIARMGYERLCSKPENDYSSRPGSNYSNGNTLLAKYFSDRR